MLLANDLETLPPVICTLLLVAVIILFVLGLLELVGRTYVGRRWSAVVGFVIALVLYVVLC